MSLQLTFSDLVNRAVNLSSDEYEKFIATVNSLRARKRPDKPSKKESELLKKINQGFPNEKWERLQSLDAKMEESALSEAEYSELTKLTEAYEAYCVERIQWLKELALLKNTSLEEAIHQSGLKHGKG